MSEEYYLKQNSLVLHLFFFLSHYLFTITQYLLRLTAVYPSQPRTQSCPVRTHSHVSARVVIETRAWGIVKSIPRRGHGGKGTNTAGNPLIVMKAKTKNYWIKRSSEEGCDFMDGCWSSTVPLCAIFRATLTAIDFVCVMWLIQHTPYKRLTVARSPRSCVCVCVYVGKESSQHGLRQRCCVNK